MMPATSENEKVRFHTLNRETQNRVVSHYVDSVTGKEVKDEDEVKGYQRGENEYVILEDEELENVALDSTKTIDIEVFAPRDGVDWIWLDTPYYLSPDDPVGQEAFSVIRDAMAAENMVGISRLVISRRNAPSCWSHAARASYFGRCVMGMRCAMPRSISRKSMTSLPTAK